MLLVSHVSFVTPRLEFGSRRFHAGRIVRDMVLSRTSLHRRDLLSGVVALAAAGTARADPASPDLRAETRKAIIHRVDVQKRGTGIVIDARTPSGAWIEAYGTTGQGGPPVNAGCRVQIASLTKVFTALLLADAARRGELGLDDPLSRHLPKDVTVPDFKGRAITLTDLATHGSGLPLRPPSRKSASQIDPYAGYTTRDLYADISAYRLERAPGAEFEYSNFAYGLLAHALEHRIGRPYAELLRARITGPLGLTQTSFTPTPAGDPRRVQGYDSELKPVPTWTMGALSAAGGLFSTPEDLMRFLELWRAPQRSGLSDAARSMLTVSRPGDDPDTRMALGWRVIQADGRRVIWSNGTAGGVRSFMGCAPDQQVSVSGFANAQTGGGVDDIATRVLAPGQHVDMSTPAVHREITLDPRQLEPLVGLYQVAPGDTVAIRREGDGLVSVVGRQTLRIYPESPTRFFFKDVEAQIDFKLDQTGRAISLVWTQGGQAWDYKRQP